MNNLTEHPKLHALHRGGIMGLDTHLRYLLVIVLCLLMMTLSSCSTKPVKEVPFVPSPSAMQQAEDLPLLPKSKLTVKEFTDNDLEIVSKYHDLGLRHDVLIREVTKYMADQRKRIEQDSK